MHIEQTNTVSLWASGAKESEKEKDQGVKLYSIKHSLPNSTVPLIPVAPILDLNTLYEQQREQQLAPQLLQFLWKNETIISETVEMEKHVQQNEDQKPYPFL